MRLLLLNPNTSASFTARIQETGQACAFPGTVVTARQPAAGPAAIDGAYDELVSAGPALEVALAEMDGYDGIAVACYSDHPLIHALREATDKPVLGIAEASMYTACLVGQTFGILTTGARWEKLLWAAAQRYGFASRCVGVRALGAGGLALAGLPRVQVLDLAAGVGARLVEQEGAEALCLGGAVFAGMAGDLTARLQVPVIDGVVSAVKLLEGLVSAGLRPVRR